MQTFERVFVQIVLATITAVTVANLIVNYKGTVAIAEVVAGFPVKLATSLRAGGNR